MNKFYRKSGSVFEYFETWSNQGVNTIYWGVVGEKGQTENVKSSLFKSAEKTIAAQIEKKKAEGFAEIAPEDHAVLLVEYPVNGMGSTSDLDKRHKLEERLNETTGWIGLGNCDGGSIGSGTMEVCCYVVDFEIAKRVIEADLKGTEFSDFSRIYQEE